MKIHQARKRSEIAEQPYLKLLEQITNIAGVELAKIEQYHGGLCRA